MNRKELIKQLKILLLQLRVLLLRVKLTIPNLKEPKHAVLHHGGGDWSFKQVNEYHRKLWGFKSSLNFYIGYNYWISSNGLITKVREDNERSAHCVEVGRPGYWNKNSVGICLQGNLNEQEPTSEQLGSLDRLLSALKLKYNIGADNIFLHKQIKNTSCPGKLLIAKIEGKYKKGQSYKN